MTIRETLSSVSRQAQMATSRGTVRDWDKKHLCLEATAVDGFHSETATNKGAPLEVYRPVGFEVLPLKQFKDTQQKKQQQKNGNSWSHDQPQGKATETINLYLNGQREHLLVLPFDRRVSPYNLTYPGDSMLYHASGTEQKFYCSDTGVYVLANNNKSEEEDAQEKERFASLRHVNLAKQKHELKKGEQVQDHKHEGDSVNLEVRVTKTRIEFRSGDDVVGYYDKPSKKWWFTGTTIENVAEDTMKDTAKVIDRTGTTSIKDTSPRIDHN